MNSYAQLEAIQGKLSFLWLELTDICNLECIHCYAQCGPYQKGVSSLTIKDHNDLMSQAFSLGCRKIQFIGGEPSIDPDLPAYIEYARKCGFTFVEVFTNLYHISEDLFQCFVDNKVSIATSFYSYQEDVHDSITTKCGSYRNTLENIRIILSCGLTLRAGVIIMDQNRAHVPETLTYLRSLGVDRIGIDKVRGIGRGRKQSEQIIPNISELCGSCWKGSLCISPDGVASPCIMSKAWAVGSTKLNNLTSIVGSKALASTRKRIYEEVYLPRMGCSPDCNPQDCNPDNDCNPDIQCNPCSPHACNPDHECGPNCNPQCSPQDSSSCNPCFPHGKCNPELYDCSPYPQ